MKKEHNLIKLFNRYFNLREFNQFEKEWVEIIGEPYSKEEFEKALKHFIIRGYNLLEKENK